MDGPSTRMKRFSKAEVPDSLNSWFRQTSTSLQGRLRKLAVIGYAVPLLTLRTSGAGPIDIRRDCKIVDKSTLRRVGCLVSSSSFSDYIHYMSTARIRALLKLIAGVFALFLALYLFARRTFPTKDFTVPSPDRRAAIVKTYSEGPSAEIKLVEAGIFGHSYLLATVPSPNEFNSDGVIVSWEGNQEITLASPRIEGPVSGPSRVGNFLVRYESYYPDLSDLPAGRFVDGKLNEPSATFRREVRDFGNARYRSTGQRVPEIDCILDVSGLDAKDSKRIDAQIIGRGIGKSDDGEALHTFGAIELKVTETGPGHGTSSLEPTLTQAQLANVFPQNSRTNAPGQDGGALVYQGYTLSEAQRMIASIVRGKFELLLTHGFNHEIRRYQIELPLNDRILLQFNACSLETNIYGVPFVVAR
jgi:hypothetical protein